MRKAGLSLGACCALLLTLIPLAGTGSAAALAPPPLPANRLEFGLSNLDSAWMTSTGVPWRYRYTYLAGGVNTSNNWLTWQDLSLPPGQFAVDYMNGSTTAPANYIPVFSWYELLQSSPSTGSSVPDRDYNNLNNAATMASYYSSFKVLMQKAGAYGKQVVVQIEPDFWAFMQQKAAGASATAVSAKVHSSGFAEASAFPDNLAGFASELKYLRDTYAPNVVLAMHASTWASRIDIASDTRSSIDAAGEADKTAAFLNSAGLAGWDAVFNDVDDHDAAWWELASCGSPPCVNQYFTHWWDPTNTRFPNFARYLAWVAELHAKTALPQIAWQVPVGNQYFLTMNNTCGHYQDNVAPYFIAHAPDLYNAGLIAVLFGGGNECQTDNEDTRKDGVTNNGGVATTDVLGGCSACNTNAASFTDDDGGYVRIFVGRYYGQCSAVSVTASPTGPQSIGRPVTITASASCPDPNPLYRFALLAPTPGATYQQVQPYSTANTFPWSTNNLAPGTYRFSVWAKDSNSFGAFGNSDGRWDTYNNGLTFTLTTCSSLSVSATPSSPHDIGAGSTSITITASAWGCTSPLYHYSILAPGATGYQLAQDYSSSNTYSWSLNNVVPGTYRFSVWARDAGSSGLYGNSSGRWDTYNNGLTYSLTSCSSVSVSVSPPSPSARGTTVTVTAQAGGCASPLYHFSILAPGAAGYQVVQDYTANSNTFTWVTTAGHAAGTYRFSVWARDGGSSGAFGNSQGRWDTYKNSTTYSLT